jgi:hypothetical protein
LKYLGFHKAFEFSLARAYGLVDQIKESIRYRSCLGDNLARHGSLKLGAVSVHLDPITADALRLFASMSGRTGHVALFYPYSRVQLQILAALEFLYQSNYVKNFRRQKVLVISDDAGRAESYYLSLRVGDVPISDFFGLSHGGKIGHQHEENRSRRSQPEDKLFITSSRRRAHLDWISVLSFGAVVMSMETGWNMAPVIAAAKIVQTNGILDLVVIEPWGHVRKARNYNDLRFHTYGWTKNDLMRSSSSESFPNYVEWGSLESELPHEIRIERLVLPRDWSTPYFEDLQALVPRLFQFSSFAPTGTIYGLYRDCLKLAVPLKLYDNECMGSFYRPPMTERLNLLSDQIGSIPSELSSADYRKAELTLRELVNGLALQSNQKFAIIMREFRASVAGQRPSAFILSNSQERYAFERTLSQLDNPITQEVIDQIGIIIGSFDALPKMPERGSLQETTFSTYPPLKRVEDVSDWLSAHCPKARVVLRRQEAESLELYCQDSENLRNFLFSPQRRLLVLDELVSGKPCEPIVMPRTDRVEIKEPLQEEIPKGPTEKDLLRILLDFEEHGTLPKHQSYEHSSGIVQPETRQGLLIQLSDGRTIALQQSKYINVYTEEGKAKVIRADKLQPGYMIILVNQSTKHSLNELILERASAYPKYRILDKSVRKWIKTLREGMANANDTPTTLLRKLRNLGSSITTPVAVYFWRRGLIIGPKDFQDIQRIATIYRSRELEEDLSGVTRAITDFRHLKRQILYSVKQSLFSMEPSKFERFQVDMSDFTDAIEIVTIRSIERREGINNEFFNKVGDLTV